MPRAERRTSVSFNNCPPVTPAQNGVLNGLKEPLEYIDSDVGYEFVTLTLRPFSPSTWRMRLCETGTGFIWQEEGNHIRS